MKKEDIKKESVGGIDFGHGLKIFFLGLNKKGTKEYNLRWGQLYDQYIRANTKRHEVVSGDKLKQLEADARAWADKQMNEEAYQLKNQKTVNTNDIARKNEVLANSKLPDNLQTTTKHNVEAVALGSLGLKGSIWSKNSVPYIASANAGNLKALDNYISGQGHNLIYTSAMGGHAEGTGHYKGNKVDIQTQGSVLTPQEYKQLYRMGYFGGNTGALGYEYVHGQKTATTPEEYEKLYRQGKVKMGNGNHYDFTVANGTQAYLEAQAVKKQAETPVVAETKTNEKVASSDIRDDLAAIVGSKAKNAKQERARNIIFNSAVDVTGSLGVWGITQLNNGVMNVGK